MANNTELHNGQYVKMGKMDYMLAPEIVNKGCKGCAFENRTDCTDKGRTDYCRQGFIFKKVN